MKTFNLWGFWKKGKGEHIGDVKKDDVFLLPVTTETKGLKNNGDDGKNPFISAKDIVQPGVDKVIINGGIQHIEDYKYRAGSFTWIKNGATYSNQITEYSHDASDPTKDRIDWVVLRIDSNNNGIIKILKGDPSDTVALPPLDKFNSETDLFLIDPDIDAGSTGPSNVSDVVIYDDEESRVDANGANVVGNASGSYSNNNCILATDFTTGDQFFVKQPTDFNPKSQTEFLFAIKSDSGRWQNNGTIKVALVNDADVVISNQITIYGKLNNVAGSPFAFDSKKNEWQIIAIPRAVLNPTSETARGFTFLKDDNRGTDSFKLDLIRAQSGITTPSPIEKTKLSEFENDVPFLIETDLPGYTIGIVANQLKLYKDAVEIDSVDLSLYLDDTNLARLTSGSLDGGTGIATFTRDDSSTFTIDLSNLLDNQNASEVPFTPTGNTTSTNVQAAIEELQTEIDGLPGGSGTGIANRHATIAALLADQGNQVSKEIHHVIDATTDATVDSGWADYEYLGTTTGDLTDYRKLTEQESLDIVASGGSSIPKIENQYTDNAAMFADQVSQTTDKYQYVQTTDLYYKYLGTTIGNISDYEVKTQAELSALNPLWGEVVIPSYSNSRDDGPAPLNKMLGTDSNGFLKMFSIPNMPAPFLDELIPDSTLPGVTTNFTLKGSFFTPGMSVVIEGQTVNSINFINDNEVILNVTTGMTEGFFNVTLDNGISNTFYNALWIVLGTIFQPTGASDWNTVNNYIDVSNPKDALCSQYNSSGDAIWNKIFDISRGDFTLTWTWDFSPFNPNPIQTYHQNIYILDAVTDVVKIRMLEYGTNGGVYTYNEAGTLKNIVIIHQNPDPKTFTTKIRVMWINNVMYLYADDTLRVTFDSTSFPNNLKMKVQVNQYDVKNIKYVEHPV